MSAATTQAPAAATPTASNLATGTLTSGTAKPAGPTSIPDTDLPTCTNDNVGDFRPFCEPQNGTQLISGKSYYVTWDQSLFDDNETVEIVINYGAARDDMSTRALFKSPRLPQSFGYYVLPIDPTWLQGQPGNETMVTLKMNSYDPGEEGLVAQNYTGPSVAIVSPSASDMPQAPSMPTNTTGLAAGLTVGLVAFLAILIGVCVWNRKRRGASAGGLGGILGGGKAGYGTRQSKRQRMKGGSDVQEEELGHHRDVELDQRDGNAFRAEIARQQTGH